MGDWTFPTSPLVWCQRSPTDEIKSSPLPWRMKVTEERICEIEKIAIEIIKSEQPKLNIFLRNEHSLGDMWVYKKN